MKEGLDHISGVCEMTKNCLHLKKAPINEDR